MPQLTNASLRKYKTIKREKPEISDEQAAAIAYSMCDKEAEGEGDSGGDGNSGIKSNLKLHQSAEITSLEQIPFIKKMVASVNKMKSDFHKIKTGSALHTHDGKQGRWIIAQQMDVFVAENQSIKNAMLEQCGCTKLAATTPGKISQERANYHKNR